MTLTALLFTFTLFPLSAQDSKTEVTAGGHFVSVSGDEGRMNDHEGDENGVLLDVRHQGGAFTLDLRFEPDTEGWLTLAWKPESPWRFELTVDRTRRYSDRSVGPELTPLGTPVSSFYPGTNTIEPVFGDYDPVTTRTRWKARAAYLFESGVVDFTLRGLELHGDKSTEPQGIAFGDFGAPAFFSPGLRKADTRQIEGALGARFALPLLTIAGRLAFGNLDSETGLTLPVWGSASLLDLTRSSESFDADTTNATLTLAHQSEGLQAAMGGSYSKVKSSNGFTNGTVDQGSSCQACGGSSVLIEDALSAGMSEVKRTDGAGSVTVEVLPGLDVRATGKLGHEEVWASGVESVKTRTYALSQSQDIDRWRASGEVTWRYEGLRLSALGGREQSTNDASFIRGSSVDESESKRTRDTIRGEARFKSGSFRVTLAAGHQKDILTMTYKELLGGYQLGSREGTRDDFRASLSGKLGKLPFSLSGSYLDGTTDLEAPLFEPVYDPTWELGTAQAKTKASTFLFHISTPGGSPFEIWAEAGYRQQEWKFPDTVTFPGYLNVDEEVKGFTAALGLVWVPAESWKVDLSGWLDAPSETVDQRAYRFEAGLEKAITKSLDGLFRFHFRRFEEALYSLDDYTLSAFTLGVRGRF
jgi:hypothetical protein